MKVLILIILLLFPQQDWEYKHGKPTSKGIDAYVEANWLVFIADYQEHIGDTLTFEPFISTDDFSDYYVYVQGDAGYFERPDNVLINNTANYIDYELRLLSNYRKSQYVEATMFVRAVVMHELTHAYIYQIMMMCQYDGNLAYEFRQGLRIIPVDNYGTEFVTEGICEYVMYDMGVAIPYEGKIVVNKKNLENRNSYEVKYRYSKQFMAPVIEEFGLRAGIYIVLSNKPPSDEEILNPKSYYDRLKWN